MARSLARGGGRRDRARHLRRVARTGRRGRSQDREQHADRPAAAVRDVTTSKQCLDARWRSSAVCRNGNRVWHSSHVSRLAF
jgi:hypothetical protein